MTFRMGMTVTRVSMTVPDVKCKAHKSKDVYE